MTGATIDIMDLSGRKPGQTRPYFCRGCNRQEQGAHIPQGWFALTQYSGGRDVPPKRMGLYCRAECVGTHAAKLAARAAERATGVAKEGSGIG